MKNLVNPLILIVMVLVTISCSSKTYTGTLTDRCLAEYKDAEAKFKNGKYWGAKEDLENVL
jgi:outer membrane protein assembly factor BamD